MTPSPLLPSGTKANTSSVEAYSSVKALAFGCKVLFLAAAFWLTVWIVFFGQPAKLVGVPLGIYQAVHCGVNSEVADPWTCDR